MTNPTPAAVAKARVATNKGSARKAQALTDAVEQAVTDVLSTDVHTSTGEAPATYHGVSTTVPLSVLTGALTSADRSEDRVSAGFTWLRLQWLALAHYKAQAKQVTGADGTTVSLDAVVKGLNLASQTSVTKSTLSTAARVYGYVGALGFDQAAQGGDAFAQAAPVARTLLTLAKHVRKEVLDSVVALAVEVPMAERGQYIAEKGKAARLAAEQDKGVSAGSKAAEARAVAAAAALSGVAVPVADGQNTGGSVPADASGRVVAGPAQFAAESPVGALVEMLSAAALFAQAQGLSADSDPSIRSAFDGLADVLGLGA